MWATKLLIGNGFRNVSSALWNAAKSERAFFVSSTGNFTNSKEGCNKKTEAPKGVSKGSDGSKGDPKGPKKPKGCGKGGEGGGKDKGPVEGTLEEHPARVQYAPAVEGGINHQIQAELNASYYYTSLAASFGRVDVALRGLEHFFWRAANQERTDALRLADYQNRRGGIVNLLSIQDPGPTARTTAARDALANSLQLQRNLTQQLLNLYQVANSNCDPVTCDFLSEHFLMKQVKRLSRNGRYITQLCRVGDSGIALHDFDEWLYNEQHGKIDVSSAFVRGADPLQSLDVPKTNHR